MAGGCAENKSMPDHGPPSYRQIQVGRFPTGFSGLDELFEALYAEGRIPSDEMGGELVARAREHNYIPPSAESAFAAALVREYRAFHEAKRTGKPRPKRDPWKGVPREQVPWFPVLDETLCDGCDKCLRFCANEVYAKRDTGSVYVIEQMNCVVGCDACARLCVHHAITFPPRSILATIGR